jgi:hypothetical protein
MESYLEIARSNERAVTIFPQALLIPPSRQAGPSVAGLLGPMGLTTA